MLKTFIVLFVCLAALGLAPTVLGQEKDPLPPDPLLQHTREVIRASFEKGMMGIRPFITIIKDERFDSPRLKAIREFAESAHQIHLAWKMPNGDGRLRAFMNPEKLEVTRPIDIDGKPMNEAWLRHTVPPEVEMKSSDDTRPPNHLDIQVRRR